MKAEGCCQRNLAKLCEFPSDKHAEIQPIRLTGISRHPRSRSPDKFYILRFQIDWDSSYRDAPMTTREGVICAMCATRIRLMMSNLIKESIQIDNYYSRGEEGDERISGEGLPSRERSRVGSTDHTWSGTRTVP